MATTIKPASSPKPFWPLLPVFLGLTALIQPWRNLACQDDAGYSVSALQVAQGHYQPHPLSLALMLPQFSLGAIFVHLFSFLPELSVLNGVTWAFFLLLVFLANRQSQWGWKVVAGFFLVPIWAQYGASYLYEIYDALLLALLVILLNLPTTSARWRLPFIALLAFALPLQQQTLAIFPFAWGAMHLIDPSKKHKRDGFALIGGVLFAVLAYAFIPRGSMQAGLFLGQLRTWQALGARAAGVALGFGLQLASGFGVFLLPLLDIRQLTRRRITLTLFAQLLLFVILWASSVPGLAAGVLFIDYFPRSLTLGFNTFGIWGAWALWDHRKQKSASPLWGTLLAAAVLILFNTYRQVIDIRYMMIVSIPILFSVSTERKSAILGGHWAWLALSFTACVFSNAYNLDTNQARWEAAAQLESQGVPVTEISAGYGRDSFRMAFDCATSATAKLEAEEGPGFLRSSRFFETIYAYNTRIYELDWLPRYVIKPATFFGVSLFLRKNVSALQATAPVRFIPYRVLGVPNRLAVFETASPRQAWCFRRQ